MKRIFRYNSEKNTKLLFERGIGFEEIIAAIESGGRIKTMPHHNKSKYPDQKIMYVRCLDEVYAVPYVIEKDGTIFLKTLFPSRKARKLLDKEQLCAILQLEKP